ncbi:MULTISPECIES: hypothetical protein [Proteiniphilum]|jgi:Spy/CpxP family protein refolding chaperone|uniref:hypothetical protein n=2 Tax=Dysgonomonadaceae TaxID=2005520 RepID=UPI001EEB6224|nr:MULTISPECIES: hypothetical protein [Proteiniphilum]ULB34102.1 hypothetical protein KDN43_14175 [Proteiniphilum propionicum]
MRKIAMMALAAIFIMSLQAMAQNNPRNTRQDNRRSQTEMRWTAKERAENMAKQLNLTNDETAKVQALFEKQDAERAEQIVKHRAERQNVMQDREQRRTEMQALREKAVAENDAELEKIIGKEKFEQWKEYRSEQQKKFRDANRQGRRNINAPGAGK